MSANGSAYLQRVAGATRTFVRRPIAAAIAAALLTAGAGLPAGAAYVELWAPPGGNIVFNDSTGTVLRFRVNGTTGDVEIPYLPQATSQASQLCFNSVTGL